MALRLLFPAIILMACGGSLPDEKRNELRQKMEANKIVRVTEVEITECAFKKGRRIVDELDSLRRDSLALQNYVSRKGQSIRFLRPNEHTNRLLEKQLIDAYLADESGAFHDNVQKVRSDEASFDTLLYTRPVTRKTKDGRDELVGVWNIWLLKKDLVREIARTR